MGPISWEELKRDIRKGAREGYIAMKEGVLVATKRAGELTEEGKKQYKVLELKTRIHKIMHGLGARVYELMGSPAKKRSPVSDKRVKEMIAQLQGYEAQIAELDRKGAKRSGVGTRRRGKRT